MSVLFVPVSVLGKSRRGHLSPLLLASVTGEVTLTLEKRCMLSLKESLAFSKNFYPSREPSCIQAICRLLLWGLKGTATFKLL